jgi:hypothetical protein
LQSTSGLFSVKTMNLEFFRYLLTFFLFLLSFVFSFVVCVMMSNGDVKLTDEGDFKANVK